MEILKYFGDSELARQERISFEKVIHTQCF